MVKVLLVEIEEWDREKWGLEKVFQMELEMEGEWEEELKSNHK